MGLIVYRGSQKDDELWSQSLETLLFRVTVRMSFTGKCTPESWPTTIIAQGLMPLACPRSQEGRSPGDRYITVGLPTTSSGRNATWVHGHF